MKIFEAFAGIGTQSLALKRIGIDSEVVGLAEWFIEAILAYGILHGFDEEKYKTISKEKKLLYLEELSLSKDTHKPASNIRNLEDDKINDLFAICKTYNNYGSILNVHAEKKLDDLDLFTYSFPCTDLSTGGKGLGMSKNSNTRSGMLWEVERILSELKEEKFNLPKVLLMENVRPILSDRHKPDFDKWIKFLEKMGYKSNIQVLNSLDFSSSQNRVRVFLISVRNDIEFDHKNFTINKKKRKTFQEAMQELCLDYKIPKYLYEAEHAALNPTPSRERMFPVNYRNIEDPIKYFGTVTTNLDRQNNAGMVYYNAQDKNKKYRLLTDRETWKLMGLTEEEYEKVKYYKNLSKVNNKKMTIKEYDELVYFSYRKMNRLSGNAIVVNVLEAIFKKLIEIGVLN